MDDLTDTTPVIETCAHCTQPMDVAALRPFSNAVCPNCGESTRVLTKMGVYEVIGKIGVGGMSVVYKAHDTLLGRDVALKVLNETYGEQPERIAKFENEAKIMARVQNEHIVKIYSVGSAWNCFYIAMELIDGDDLETFVRENGAIIEPQVIDIALQIVDGLEAAWNVGMLHRDIKPANILTDASGVSKIVDFGLSLLNTQESKEQEVWATPYYASPETLLQSSEDFRSDMYALGCSLFQMLVGEPPFKEIPNSISALLEIKKKLPKLEKVAPDISPATCKIINKLMEYSAQKRYSSYKELKSDLMQAAAALQGNTQNWKERRRSLIRKAKRNRVRNVSLISLGGALVLSLILGIILSPKKTPPAPLAADDTAPKTVQEAPKTTVDIGEMYKRAEGELGKGDLANAIRLFNAVTALEHCPLSTYSWAATQSALCSWIQGNVHDKDETFAKLLKKLNASDEVQRTPRVKELWQIVDYLSAKGGDARLPDLAGDSVAKSFFLIADSLKQWGNKDYKVLLSHMSELERLTQNADESQSLSLAWLHIMNPYIEDAKILESIANMPEESIADIDAKQIAITQSKEKQLSSGDSFPQILGLMEHSLIASREDLKNKLAAAGPTATPNDTANAPDNPVEQNYMSDAEFQQRYNAAIATLKNGWNFEAAEKDLREMSTRVNKPDEAVAIDTTLEMIGLVVDLMKLTNDDLGKLPLPSRTVTLTDNNTAVISGIDANQLTLEKHPQGIKTVPTSLLGASEFINLHRNCIANVEKRADFIKKRHAEAVVFLYLIGEKSQAAITATILAKSDPDFAGDWKRWMMVLEPGEQPSN